MNKIEKKLWKKLKEQMQGIWDAQRHEDKYSMGIPDVSFGLKSINGWIELKAIETYPKRAVTPIRLRHFTPLQKNWLSNRQSFGGNCWLMVQILSDIYMFRGDNLDGIGETLNREWFVKRCDYHDFNKTPFATWLPNVLLGNQV